MLYKNVSNSSISGVIKDVDVKTGTVTGYFSIFGNVDSDGDMIMPGAFKRTLENNYRRAKHLYQHDFLHVLSGTKNGNLTLKEDSKGLYFESKITETSYGADVVKLYESGALDEHSIGYEVKKQNKASSYNELLELKLWEGSTVTWGANEMAITEQIKSMNPQQLLNKYELFHKELRTGKYETEEILNCLQFIVNS
jgi:HK97 family phage prohead protease